MSQSKRIGALSREHRLDWIEATLKAFGPKTTREVFDKWHYHCAHSHKAAYVTTATIVRDLALLVRRGRITKRLADEREQGPVLNPRKTGHEYGGGRRITYNVFEVKS